MNDVYDKTRMFAAVPHDVLDEVKNANAIALYTILKRYAGANGKAHPSRKKLAADMGFKSAMPVDKALEELRSAGLVQTFPRFKDESGKVSHQRDDDHRVQTSNGYIITDPHTSQMYTPTFQNVDPHTSQMHTPYIGDVHEVDTSEVDTSEVDPPVVPQRGTGAGRRQRNTYPEAFEKFWAPYPKKAGKPKALENWRKAIKNGADPEQIAEASAGYARLCEVSDTPDSKIKHPQGWITDGRYEDDYDTLIANASKRTTSQQDQRRMKLVEAGQRLMAQQGVHHDQRQLG